MAVRRKVVGSKAASAPASESDEDMDDTPSQMGFEMMDGVAGLGGVSLDESSDEQFEKKAGKSYEDAQREADEALEQAKREEEEARAARAAEEAALKASVDPRDAVLAAALEELAILREKVNQQEAAQAIQNADPYRQQEMMREALARQRTRGRNDLDMIDIIPTDYGVGRYHYGKDSFHLMKNVPTAVPRGLAVRLVKKQLAQLI